MTNEIEVILADYERANENGLGQAACARLIAALRETVEELKSNGYEDFDPVIDALRGDKP